jgi:hypothetical protein
VTPGRRRRGGEREAKWNPVELGVHQVIGGGPMPVAADLRGCRHHLRGDESQIRTVSMLTVPSPLPGDPQDRREQCNWVLSGVHSGSNRHLTAVSGYPTLDPLQGAHCGT